MAFSAKTFSFFFLTVLISSFQVQIQARESKFFYKFTHISTKNKVIPESKISLAPTPAPAPPPTSEAVPTIAAEPAQAPAESPASLFAESGSGYGLYGHGSDQFPPTKESATASADQNELLNEELSSENYETGYQNNYNSHGYTSKYNNNGYTSKYNNNGYTNKYNNNGYRTQKQGMSDTRFMQNYQDNNYNNNVYASIYKNNAYASSRGYTGDNNYNTNGYENEKLGMSDTRFLENGKYYYDVKNENSYVPAGFESDRGTTTSGGYYGNTQNVNEFSTMEQFENQQEYQESPEEYVP